MIQDPCCFILTDRNRKRNNREGECGRGIHLPVEFGGEEVRSDHLFYM